MKLPRRGALAAGRGTDGGKWGSPRGPSPLPMRPQAGQPAGRLEPHPAPRRQAEALRLSVVSSEATHTSQGPCERRGTRAGGAGARRASRGLSGHGPPGDGAAAAAAASAAASAPVPPGRALWAGTPPQAAVGSSQGRGRLQATSLPGGPGQAGAGHPPRAPGCFWAGRAQGDPRQTLPRGPACPLRPFCGGHVQGEPRRTLPRHPICPLRPLVC